MRRIWSTEYSFDLWLKVEIAVCEAWNELGVVPKKDLEQIEKIRFNRSKYDEIFDETKHDLIAFTRAISDGLGSSSRWIHYGLTSNDVKDSALSVQLREATKLIVGGIKGLQEALLEKATKYKNVVCIGRSHGMHAEPMSFGFKFALWYDEFLRHLKRLEHTLDRVSVLKISGPVGSYSTTDPRVEEIVGKKLGLKPILANQVIQRDIHAEYLQNLALVCATIEKVALEIRHLQRSEVAEVAEPFGKTGFVTKGSSSMPHKRNPELAERICGLSRVVRANSGVGLENVALWHERDISHSSAERIVLPDSSLATDYICHLMTLIIKDLDVNLENIKRNLDLGKKSVFAPRIMLALVEKGEDRAKAYDLVQSISQKALMEKIDFETLVLSDQKLGKIFSKQEILKIFNEDWFIRYIDHQYKQLGIT